MMTREEAVARIKDHIEIHRYHERSAVKIFEALDMAIKALEQPEPCEDAVSRHRLLNDLKELIAAWEKYPVMAEQIKGVETAIGYVKTIPSVTPDRKQGKWIPVTYRYVADENNFPKTKIVWQDATEPDDVEGMKCSKCGTIFDFTEARNWCSECGADMREEQNEIV